VHRVLLTGDFNAAIVQVPRLGPLGWERNLERIDGALVYGR
jgi:hypothetical protein